MPLNNRVFIRREPDSAFARLTVRESAPGQVGLVATQRLNVHELTAFIEQVTAVRDEIADSERPTRVCVRCGQIAVCDVCTGHAVWHWKGGGRDQHLCQADQITLREQAVAAGKFRDEWLLTVV